MKFLSENFLHKQSFAGWIFILPAILGTFVFIIIPLIASFSLSFCKWDLLNDIQFVGFENYKTLFKEPTFFKILLNTVIFAISTSIFAVIIPLILACILNSKIKFKEFFKTIYFLPFITPMIAVGIAWEWIFDPNIGILSHFIKINWLYDTHFAMPAIIIVSVWKLIGYNMLIFLTGLTTINQELLESSKLDGANSFQTFKNITIPLLSPTILFVIIITTISSFQVFDLIYLMTQGGPSNSTNVLVFAIYNNAFKYFDIGKASAIAYVLFVIIFILAMFQWHFRKKFVYTDTD